MFKAIDQFILIPVCVVIVLFALLWLVQNPTAFLITLGLMGVVFSVLVVKKMKYGK